jgi:hypothetical protein
MPLSKKRKFINFLVVIAVISSILYWTIPDNLRGILILVFLMSIFSTGLVLYLPQAEYHRNLLLGLGLVVTVLGWSVNEYINSRQAVLQKQRDLKVKLLLDAYFRLEGSDNRNSETSSDAYIYQKYAESAIQAIQLLGDERAIELARGYALSNGKEHYNELLEELRREIRRELNLSSIPINGEFNPAEFRVGRNGPFHDTITSDEQIQLITKLNDINRDLLK